MIDLSVAADMKYKPTLYDVHRLLDQWIVGEHKSRMAVLTNWVLGCQNVNVAAQRAAGKTHCVTNVAKFLPDRNGFYNLARGSEKSTWYQAEKLRTHSHIMVPELNKLNKDTIETLKEWGENRTATYKVTVGEGRQREVEEIKLKPKPFIFCLADEEEMKIDEQLRSRLTVVRMDISEQQNKAVMQQKADLAMMPRNPKKVEPGVFKKMKEHIGMLPPFKVENFRHPAANVFVKCIPSVYTDCRRDFPKYLNNTYGITRFYWKERMHVTIDEEKIWLVTPSDMYHNHLIYGQTLIESSLRCSNMERQLIAILQTKGEPMNKAQIQQEVQLKGMNISAHMISRHMKNLTDQGYVETVRMGAGLNHFSVGSLFKDFTFAVDWNEVIKETAKNMAEYYPDIAGDYISKFVDTCVTTDPFTGEEVDLKLLSKTSIDTKGDIEVPDPLPEGKVEIVEEEIVG